ncbi:probable F-box protein At4g22030 [Diospyros lotus]|uniref:probable F-box protein At4g22030 n=1 Tax=Diospyros lotus TaxID=55363 RepID=UPI0022552A19|nr:probable F-box protein At4g22030 [Diospyros lotus]
MASLQASSCITLSSISSSSCCRRDLNINATIKMPKLRNRSLVLPKATSTTTSSALVEELELTSGYKNTKSTTGFVEKISAFPRYDYKVSDPMVTVARKFYAIMEAIEDRVEMHKNIGEQRNNWNSLLLASLNTITLAAATMAGIAGTVADTGGAPLSALKLSSTFLYLAATGMLIIMNKIQPSQLVEEQRNAARFFKQLHAEMRTMVSLGNPLTLDDVNQATDKVLALDRAFPLPLLGVMLEKFPATMEPAVWWPRQQQRRREAKGHCERKNDGNGWDVKLEEEMREIVGVLKRKDKADYLRLGEKALKLNKALAISGPLLTGLAAIGSALVGLPSHGSWAVVLGVVAGALSSIVNTVQHGWQVGMVLEMYRGNAGFFRLMEESIQSTLKEEVERRENGELFEMKVALQLGRSLTELKDLASVSSIKGAGMEEFGSKLF